MIIEIRDEVVALSGVLQSNQWLTLQSAVKVRLKHHPNGIVVDCGGLTALSREGAATFTDAARHISASGARIVVANVPPEIMRVLRQIPNLRSQLPLAETVAEARGSLGIAHRSAAAHGALSNIVVALMDTEADPHAVAMACRIGQIAQTYIHLTYLLTVPRNVPLLAPLGPQEEVISQTLEQLETAVRATRMIPVRRIERTRNPANRLLEVASEIRAEAIVLALPADVPEDLASIARLVLGRAECDVLINRLPIETAAAAGAPAKAGAR